jgi:AcrR family transcriptional regulator
VTVTWYDAIPGTRGKIFQVGVKLFAAKGYSASSLRDIASAVGIEPASLYNHIKSKEELLFTIVSEATRDGTEFIKRVVSEAEATPEAQLRAAVWANTVYHARHPHTAKIGQYELHSLSLKRYRTTIALRDKWEAIFRKILQAGIASGRFRAMPVTPTVAGLIGMGAYSTLWFKPHGPMTAEQLADLYADLAVRIVLSGGAKLKAPRQSVPRLRTG